MLADDTRASVCDALMDGRAWTAGELASAVGVTAATMSEHLNRLVDSGLLVEERQGRHRYLRLADAETAQLLEMLGSRAGGQPRHPVGLRQVRADAALTRARTCYDHVAGHLGVLIADAMARLGLLDIAGGGMTLTPAGETWTLTEGLTLTSHSARPRVRPCLDWTERRHHVGGQLGAALCRHLIGTGAVERAVPERTLRITPAGELWLRQSLGISASEAGALTSRL